MCVAGGAREELVEVTLTLWPSEQPGFATLGFM